MTWRTVLGTLFIVATTIITAFWAINEPMRMAEYEAGFQGRSIEAGAGLFENNCVRCHGPQGEGLPGLAPGINTPEMFNGARLAEVGWAGTLEDYIHGTVASGRPVRSEGTTYPQRMPTWSREFGGPLRPDQVRNLVDFIMNWELQYDGVYEVVADTKESVVETGLDVVETVGTDLVIPDLPTGDAVSGEQLTATLGCVACHIQTDVGPAWMAEKDPNGNGIGSRAAARIISSEYTGAATTSEQYLRESIVRPDDYVVDGYPPSTMVMTYGDQLSPQDLADLIAYLMRLE